MLAPLTAPAAGTGEYDPAADPDAPIPATRSASPGTPAPDPHGAAHGAVDTLPADTIESRVMSWGEGLRVAEEHLTRMARRGMIACADVWIEVGAAMPVETAPTYLVPVAADGAHDTHPDHATAGTMPEHPDDVERVGGPAGRTPDTAGPLTAFPGHGPRPTGKGPSGASGRATHCRIMAEPFGPAWAVLAARALDQAGYLNAHPETVTAFLAAADRDAGLYGRIVAALVSTLGAGGDRDGDATRDVRGYAGPYEGTVHDAVVGSRCLHAAMRWAVDASTETRDGAWRRHIPKPSRYVSVAGGPPVVVPAGSHPVVGVYLAHAHTEARRKGIPGPGSAPPVPRR